MESIVLSQQESTNLHKEYSLSENKSDNSFICDINFSSFTNKGLNFISFLDIGNIQVYSGIVFFIISCSMYYHNQKLVPPNVVSYRVKLYEYLNKTSNVSG